MSRRAAVLVAWLWVACPAALAQRDRVITTIAGTEYSFPEGQVRALEAFLGGVHDVILDRVGNVYVSGNHRVVRVTPAGFASVYAGNGIRAYSGDGEQATQASLNEPAGMALDAAGNMFIADRANERIRRVDARTGIITTAAGTGVRGFLGDGEAAVRARLFRPDAVAVDANDALFISDTYNNRIRRVDRNGIIRTIAGTGQATYNGDNRPAESASLNLPRGITFGSDGSLFIADWYNHRIRRISPQGVITTVAGDGRDQFAGDRGPGPMASVKYPADVAFDRAGNLYIAEESSNRIRLLAPTTIIDTVVGNGQSGFSGDGGNALAASLNLPQGVAVSPAGTIYITDNGRVRAVTNGIIDTLAGGASDTVFRSGIPALSAVFGSVRRLARDAAGNIFISDEGARLVRRIGLDGFITTVAGNGNYGYNGDGGPARSTRFSDIRGLAIDPQGNIYIADRQNHRVRVVDRNGIVTNFAGQGRNGYRDGLATTEALLASPNGLTFGPDGALYLADEETYTIRRIANGRVTTIAGTGSSRGPGGDGGPATRAQLDVPYDLCFDPAGNLFIAELEGHRIRRVDRNGVITRVAGIGVAGYNGDDMPAIGAQLSFPTGLACAADGSVYIAEERPTPRIRRIQNGTITTVAGDGVPGFRGDGGPAGNARFTSPTGLLLDPAGNLYIADNGNQRLRQILAVPPSFAVSSNQLDLTARAGAARVSATLDVRSTILPLPYATQVRGGDGWLEITPSSGNLSTRIRVAADPSSLDPGVYTASITISSPQAMPPTQTIDVRLEVQPALPPAIEAGTADVLFGLIQGTGPATQRVQVFNRGGGTLNFDARVEGADWLTVAADPSRATNSVPGLLTLTASPDQLAVGTYRATIVITDPENQQTARVAVATTVSAPSPVILLSQTGLSFQGVVGGSAPLPQTVSVFNTGTGAPPWTARATTLSGGDWLAVTPASGSAAAASRDVSSLQVLADSSRLEAGQYFGEIEVRVDGAPNSPQTVIVLLNVVEAGGAELGLEIRPSEIIFAAAEGSSPGSQKILLNNQSRAPVTYGSALVTLNGGNWLQYLPGNGTINAGDFAAITVQPDLTGLPAGVYRATISLSIRAGATTVIRPLNVVLVVFPESPAAAANRGAGRQADASCLPTRLLPSMTFVGSGTRVNVAWPTPIEARVVDDCGQPMTSGAMTVAFSNGDRSVPLTSLGDGRWTGSWVVRNPADTVSVMLAARSNAPVLEGTVEVSTALIGGSNLPLLEPGAAVSMANSSERGPVAPGTLVSIRGERLATQPLAAQLPLPPILGQTRVIFGGRVLPILWTSQDRIDAMMPFDVPVNTTLQLVVRNGTASSAAEPLAIAAAQPAVFVPGPGGYTPAIAVLRLPLDGAPGYASAENPLRPGDAIVIYCGGLGTVDREMRAGDPAPESPRAIPLNSVQVRIGGVEATVEFAGLAVGLAGVYEIRAVVPEGIVGGQASLTVTVAGQSSAPVTVEVR